ncbi:hypothetical protein PoB_001964700 [Plakobranchus ocellatus]|uniref:Uncharacterized protein n=1 Tax=Plakobranchus ocellatus TaxID=259542 RepID=A0AAV3ZF24_9GAST|nr:hypothetical protein PoB_001964700 [Plakobranchus ocellatus]
MREFTRHQIIVCGWDERHLKRGPVILGAVRELEPAAEDVSSFRRESSSHYLTSHKVDLRLSGPPLGLGTCGGSRTPPERSLQISGRVRYPRHHRRFIGAGCWLRDPNPQHNDPGRLTLQSLWKIRGEHEGGELATRPPEKKVRTQGRRISYTVS